MAGGWIAKGVRGEGVSGAAGAATGALAAKAGEVVGKFSSDTSGVARY